jgi:hypothetical protein
MDVEPDDMNDFQSTMVWLHKMFDKNKDPEPLFELDLVRSKNNLIPIYSNPPEDIVNKLMNVFDEGVDSIRFLPQVEPILMRHLFRAHSKKFIKAPTRPSQKPPPVDPKKPNVLPDENTWLWEAYAELKEALTIAIQPLYEYVQTFSEFKEEHELNPDKYIKSIDEEAEEPLDAEGLRADIYRVQQLEEDLKHRIPESITVSIFKISINDIRKNYTDKYEKIIDKEVKLIAQKAQEKNYQISTKFDEINERIQRVPKDIMELHETKKYISEIGIVIEKSKKEIDLCMRIYDIADEFNHEFSGNENDAKWVLFGSPNRIMETIQQQS